MGRPGMAADEHRDRVALGDVERIITPGERRELEVEADVVARIAGPKGERRLEAAAGSHMRLDAVRDALAAIAVAQADVDPAPRDVAAVDAAAERDGAAPCDTRRRPEDSDLRGDD